MQDDEVTFHYNVGQEYVWDVNINYREYEAKIVQYQNRDRTPSSLFVNATQ